MARIREQVSSILASVAKLDVKDLLDYDGKLDHVLVQAYFSKIGRGLGFETGCNRQINGGEWDVIWRKKNQYVRVEVEPLHQGKVLEDFNKICMTADKVPEMKLAILVLDEVPLGKLGEDIDDYLFDVVFNPEKMKRPRFYPKKFPFTLLSINLRFKTYQLDDVGPKGRRKIETNQPII